jgi:NADPH-dependent ferric siderophore reductase
VSNVTVTHAPSGLIQAEVVRSERVTPHMVRVTLGGSDLARYEFRGFDQWMRLAIPVGGARLDNLPDRYDLGGFLKFKTLPRGTRPVIRNYTARAFRPDALELDIDFIVHGTAGVAAPWAVAAQPGERIAFIDQGCGWAPVAADSVLMIADETGLPAVAGILRDLPRETTGHAVIELFDEADRQPLSGPDGVEVHWVTRAPGAEPGSAALPALRSLDWAGSVYAFAVGESAVATGARRHLVGERGVPKTHVTFCGYWKRGRA